MDQRQARIVALNRVIALLSVQLSGGVEDELGATLLDEYPEARDRDKVFRAMGRIIDDLAAQRDRLERGR